MKRIFFLHIIFLPLFTCAQKVLELRPDAGIYTLDNSVFELYEDTSGIPMSFDKIRQTEGLFKASDREKLENVNPQSTYWLKIKVKNLSRSDITWLLESYNYSSDTLAIYYPDENGIYLNQVFHKKDRFSVKKLKHKNPSFPILAPYAKEVAVYLRLKHDKHHTYHMVIRSYDNFTSYYLYEYYLYGLFYGILLCIALYNLILFFSLADKAYLHYVLYMVSLGMYMMFRDGSALQFLIPEYPQYTDIAYSLLMMSSMVFMLFYTYYFLELTKHKLVTRILWGFVGVRIALFLLFIEYQNFLFAIDILANVLAYGMAVYAYWKMKYRPARFFLAGFTILFAAYLINFLWNYNIINADKLAFYSLNVAVVLEALLLSLALADRIKQIRMNSFIKEQVNRSLEMKVQERTNVLFMQQDIIANKVKELDTFLYKASHDLKGPLKSIEGLCLLALNDPEEENKSDYIERIRSSSQKLGGIVTDILELTKMKNFSVHKELVDIPALFSEVQEGFREFPGYKEVQFRTEFTINAPFYSEKTSVYSIFQNLIENAVKYLDKSKKEHIVKVRVVVEQEECVVTFEDNGIGIDEKDQAKVFDMFYQVSQQRSDSSGLGLYIVKLAIERLQGTIELESIPKVKTVFLICIPNKNE